MSHADSKGDVRGRRTVPPLRSHGGPASMVVPAGSHRSTPPPPPLAALRQRDLPKITPELELALVPQWENLPDPMRPPQKRFGSFLWKLGGSALAVGALLAAGYGGALLHASHERQTTQSVAVASERGLVTKLDAPMLTSTAPAANAALDESAHARQPQAAPVAAQPSAASPVTQAQAQAEPQATEARRVIKGASRGSSQPRVAKPAKTLRAAAAKPGRGKLKLAPHVAPVPTEQTAASAGADEAQPQAAAPVSTAKLARSTKKEPAGALPEQPSRTDVQTGIEKIRPALTACAAGARGTVFANLTIVGSGRVTYSVVEGEFTSGSVGTCMAKALRSASFPQFSGPSFKVRYPFVF